MIPKIVHYCWFGRGPKPKLAEKCIASWRKFLPDYEIKEWNEDNYDVRKIPFIAEAYDARKYAFVSDYARFDILHKFGGVYFDTDVEVVQTLDDILGRGAFMGLENAQTINPGLGLAVERGHELYRTVLDFYAALHFKLPNGALNIKPIGNHVTELYEHMGLVLGSGVLSFNGINIYPVDYFNPKLPNGKIVMTENTRCIHHYSASWYTPRERMIGWVGGHFGKRAAMAVGLLTRNPLAIPARAFRYWKDGK